MQTLDSGAAVSAPEEFHKAWRARKCKWTLHKVDAQGEPIQSSSNRRLHCHCGVCGAVCIRPRVTHGLLLEASLILAGSRRFVSGAQGTELADPRETRKEFVGHGCESV